MPEAEASATQRKAVLRSLCNAVFKPHPKHSRCVAVALLLRDLVFCAPRKKSPKTGRFFGDLNCFAASSAMAIAFLRDGFAVAGCGENRVIVFFAAQGTHFAGLDVIDLFGDVGGVIGDAFEGARGEK